MIMRIHLSLKLSTFVLIIFLGCQDVKRTEKRWSVEQSGTWYSSNGWLRGSDFIPSNAVNQLEMWQAETFDTVTIDRELGYAASLGFNVMRVFLHHKAWLQDPDGFKTRMDRYLSISSTRKIKTMFVFFDDCWNGTSKTGKQPAPKPGIHNSGWLQDPGQKESSDTAEFPVLEKYVKDILDRFANDNRIVLWDLYNEPGNTNKSDSSLNLLRHVFSWARETKISQPVTSGVWDLKITNISKFQLENSDIISFHNYGSETWMKKEIDSLRYYKRPLVCSEYMARSTGSNFKNILPLLKKENVGAINWGLVMGKTNTIYAWSDTTHTDGSEPAVWHHDIFRQDGTPYSRDEAELIRNICLSK
jgi:hypothetical protein